MPATTTPSAPLPLPTKKHATCAWCRCDFTTIVELIDHVDRGHVDPVTIDDRERVAA